MSWQELERVFNRSLQHSFSKKKFFFLVPVLLGCGVLITFFRVLAIGAGSWVKLSLSFFPVFICSSLLLASGIVLIRLYHHEVKNLTSSLRDTIRKSRELMTTVAYLTLPIALAYLLVWTVTGVFFLLKEIPLIGNFVAVVLSFAPFLLVLMFFVLNAFNLLLLFFLTPAIALRSQCSLEMIAALFKFVGQNVFSHLALFVLGTVPVGFIVAVLWVAGQVTENSYIQASSAWGLLFQWLITMLPFCALAAPAGIFFFNFSAEAYALMQKKPSATS